MALLLLAPAPASAQSTELVSMDVGLSESLVEVPVGGVGILVLTVRDTSMDGTGSAPGTPPAGIPHSISFEVQTEKKQGWALNIPPGRSISSGQEREFEFRFLSTQAVGDPYYPATITVVMRGNGQEVRHNVTVTAYSPGRDGFNAQVSRSFIVEPEQISTVPLRITNIGLYPRTFDLEVADNPCNVAVSPPSSIVVGGKSTEEVFVTVQGPTDRLWYFTEPCSITLRVVPQDNPNIDRTVILGGQVNGGYFNPVWAFWAVGLLLAAVLLVLFVADRKARIEEELLGKPQKPWTIPVEKVYLDHLKQRDPRAHYVVRHFLMEEEYASSLLWYREFKRATAGTRSKERIVVSQERKVERFRRKWDRIVARPVGKADRLEARLQKRLDRKGKGSLRKQHQKWRKTTRRMQAAYEAKVKRATGKWEKQAARAQRKDKPVPEKPSFPRPDYPVEPTGDRLLLAEHKWNRKAQRFRARRLKQQGDLEVKAEKKEARLLHKVRKRVEKVARRLDDPDFAAEHPLLGGKAAAESVRRQAEGQ